MQYLNRLKLELVRGEFENPIKGQVREPAQMYAVFKDIKNWAKETAIGVYMSDNLELNSYEIHSVGGEKYSVILPEEIFRSAILTRSKYIVLIHNHPSGMAKPSEEDWEVIKLLQEQSIVMNRRLLDFIIVGETSYWSLFEHTDGGEYTLGTIG